ncbi:hypothetical protein HY496_02400, partial [Candidatus Woesearchaeota archaeon]|nr:hypothetical protein [Candidatus Woesearchaeota archaeon]
MSRIIKACCYYGALEKINQELGSKFPVYLRGIASSRDRAIALPNLTEKGNDAIVKTIEEIVENGTELSLDSQGTPLDRPEDGIKEGIVTRVASYSGINNT